MMTNVIVFLLALVAFIGIWKIFEKANYPGWMGIIPGFNLYVLLRILDLSPWLLLTYLIPGIGFITFSYTSYCLAKRFNKGPAFIAGMILLPFLFYFILGFDNSKFIKDVH